MYLNTRTYVLGLGVVLAVLCGGLILWWDPQPPALPDYFIHNPISKTLHRKPRLAPQLATAPEHPPIPAALTATPPIEVWLPRALSADDKAKRIATDQYIMKAEALSNGTLMNVMALDTELVNQQYDQIESQLDAMLAMAINNPEYELVEKKIANFADGDDITRAADKFLIDDWVKARPNSPWAHYSAGLRWSNMAWDARGSGWAQDVPKGNWHKVHLYEGNARAELHKALKLNPKISPAWVTLMNVDMTDASMADVKRDYAQASTQRPTDFQIPNGYVEALNPHWYGSYDVIADFARSQQDKVGVNPHFYELLGYTEADRGCISCNNYDWQTSLKHYNAALAYADDPYMLDMAGDAAAHLHRYALAYRYYERAHHYQPGVFRFAAETQVLQAICDPNENPEKFKALRSDALAYGGVQMMEYPHVPGDCAYYQAELPWGDEPTLDTSSILPYQVNMPMPAQLAPQKGKQ